MRHGWLAAAACALAALAAQLRASFVQTKAPPIEDHFAADWALARGAAAAYSRNFNRQREFAFAACLPSHCNVTLLLADAARPRSRTCELLVGQISSYGSSGISSLHLPDGGARSQRLALVWWRRVGQARGAFVNSVNMSDCRTSIAFPVGGAGGRAPHVLVYRHPVYSTVAAEADYRVVMTHTFSGGWIRNIHHVGVNHSWTGEEQPVELGASRGFFLLGSDDEAPDRRLSVIYANVSSGWKWVMAEIRGLNDSAHTYPKSSGAYRKYGLCWKSLERDARVNCSQFLRDGRKAVRQVGLRLPEPVDWLAVHNLREPALLLVTGQCHGPTCAQFRVAKLHADGRLSAPFDVKTLDARCPRAPADLSMDVVEDPERQLVCFHFVCLDRRAPLAAWEPAAEEPPELVLQYRRNCVKRADVDRMFE
ncbi:uncharacterized protein LOC131667135 [Phymastichus coffea]|uniref:uncharacterized protein LOC131667135 n=1 Tax=Phymastichus coffea TaxID=108790 RepID=UPI00273C25D1|nr:uncharacterized protein LOC131667135 [Phymastichus coffea]